MIVYFRNMRTQDEEKKEALFQATVKLVNEIGFASSSVSKIAKEAAISPSTVYIYYENKQDLLISTYMQIKGHMGKELMENFDESLPMRDIIKNIWLNMFRYITTYPHYNAYVEQFANSPFYSMVDKSKIEGEFAKMLETVNRGIEQKIIKDVDPNFLYAFIFKPVTFVANPHLCGGKSYTAEDMETAFDMAWDAIRL